MKKHPVVNQDAIYAAACDEAFRAWEAIAFRGDFCGQNLYLCGVRNSESFFILTDNDPPVPTNAEIVGRIPCNLSRDQVRGLIWKLGRSFAFFKVRAA